MKYNAINAKLNAFKQKVASAAEDVIMMYAWSVKILCSNRLLIIKLISKKMTKNNNNNKIKLRNIITISNSKLTSILIKNILVKIVKSI